MSFIRTYTGYKMDFEDIRKESINLFDIAHALSRAPRFGGHTNQDWSVAEHSILCSYMGDTPRMKMAALMHDAAEAYTGDLHSSLKWYLAARAPGILRGLEYSLEYAIEAALGVPLPVGLKPEELAEIKRIDSGALRLEAESLLYHMEDEDFARFLPLSDTEQGRAAKVLSTLTMRRQSAGHLATELVANTFMRRFHLLKREMEETSNPAKPANKKGA